MAIDIVFETHSVTEDNEQGFATGWLPGRLSETGRHLARELGERRRDDGLSAVFTSDLHRATETADLAFGDTGLPILADWRLRECDYGMLNGAPATTVHAARVQNITSPFPAGESWAQAVERVGRFLRDLPVRWKGTRVLVIGHMATRWGLEHHLNRMSLLDLSSQVFEWRPGWDYRLPDDGPGSALLPQQDLG